MRVMSAVSIALVLAFAAGAATGAVSTNDSLSAGVIGAMLLLLPVLLKANKNR